MWGTSMNYPGAVSGNGWRIIEDSTTTWLDFAISVLASVPGAEEIGRGQ